MRVTVLNNESSPEITQQILNEVSNQPIYWSDDRNEHWMFDFKCFGYWVEANKINNELTEISINIFKP